jgi:hypothetical protein
VTLAALLYLCVVSTLIAAALLKEIRSSRRYRLTAIGLMDDRLTVDLYEALRAVIADQRRDGQGEGGDAGSDSAAHESSVIRAADDAGETA